MNTESEPSEYGNHMVMLSMKKKISHKKDHKRCKKNADEGVTVRRMSQ
jgi:hypothetical protein